MLADFSRCIQGCHGRRAVYGTSMPLPLARTHRELVLYVQLHPCACGTSRVEFLASAVLTTATGMAQRHKYLCRGCQQPREFLCALPERPLHLPEHHYGDERPSELLDPGEWLWVSVRHAALATQSGGARLWQDAAAAVDEAIKFVPLGAAQIPADTIPSDLGNAVRKAMPAAFTREALLERANRYRQGQLMTDEAQLPEFRIGRPDGVARNRLMGSLKERVGRTWSTSDFSPLLDREAVLEIDALCGPTGPFDLLASYVCGMVCWERYLNTGSGFGIDDLARAIHLMGAVHDKQPRYHLSPGDDLKIPPELLMIIENRHVR